MDKNSSGKPAMILLLLAVFLLLAAVFGTVSFLKHPAGHIVEVVQDNKVLYTFDLTEAEDQEIVIPYQGSSNTVVISDGTIRVAAAECPDHICVHMGILRSEMPIVCLPNHLIIRFAERK